MGKWILDTSTKGTGASMVPLEKALQSPGGSEEEPLALVPLGPRRPEQPAEPEAAPRPRTFKVVDVLSREVVAEDVSAAAALHVLERFRSAVDVHVHVREPGEERWRLLTLGELNALWKLRGRVERGA